MNHWKKGLFVAAALVAALPIARGQSAPVAAPAGTLRAVSAKADDTSPADRAYLGVYPSSDAEGGGVKLEQVVDGSPAAKAGLQSGDVITAFGDRTVGSDEELRSAIASHQSGEKVKITFLRDGEKRRTSARLGKAPSENEAGGGEAPAIKERVVEKTDSAEKAERAEKAAKSGAKGGGGVVEVAPAKESGEDAGYMGVTLTSAGDGRTSVSTVVDGSPAQKAGIQAGDVILKIDGEEAASVEELVGLVTKHHAGDKVTVTVERDGKAQKIKVKLASRSAANLGGGAGVGSLAAPVPNAPETKTVETPAAPRTARARATKPAAGGEAAGPDAMRKEVEGMRSELEHLRRSMDELQRRCESQQRTIEKIRRALDGNDEPGSVASAGMPAATTVATVADPFGGSVSVTGVPSELATAGSATSVVVPDGGQPFEIVSGDGAVNVPVILQVDGSEQKIELEGLGQQIQALVQKHADDGHVILVKPKVDGQTIQLVLDGEGGGSCCAEGQCKVEAGEPNVVIVHGAKAGPAKNVKVMRVGGQGMGGAMNGAMKVAPSVRKIVVQDAPSGMGGGAHEGCGCCCCGNGVAAMPGAMGGHPGAGHPGMGMGMGGGAPGSGTFVMPAPPPPMRARMHPGFPGMPAEPAAPRGGMKFEMKGPQAFPQMQMAGGGTMVWKCEGPCELSFGPQGAQFRCEGSCEISQNRDATEDTADVTFEGVDADDFGETSGSGVFTFSEDGSGEESEDADDGCCEDSGDCGACEESGSCGQCEEESGDDDDSGSNGDDDDDDDDASVAVPASIAYPAV